MEGVDPGGRRARGLLVRSLQGSLALAALLLQSLAADASAQTVRVYALADSVTVGERFPLAVAVEHRGEGVLFPQPPLDPVETPLAFGDAEVLDLRRLPPSLQGPVRVDSAVYEAVVFALDTARVGPANVRLIAGGDTTEVRGGLALLPVRSLVAEGDEPRDLDPPLDFPPAWPWWAWALIVAVPVALLIWWLLRRRGAPSEPPRTPTERVRARLDALEREPPASPEAIAAWFVGLSEALRAYLLERLDIPAPERTTDETVALLTDEPRVPQAARDAFARALAQADLVKFADVRPNAPAREAALQHAREAVDTTEAAIRAAEEAEAERAAEGRPPTAT